MKMRKLISITVVVALASIAMIGGMFARSAQGQSQLKSCEEVTDNDWKSATDVFINDDTIEFQGEGKSAAARVRVLLRDQQCADPELEAFLRTVRQQSDEIVRGDCNALRDVQGRAIAAERNARQRTGPPIADNADSLEGKDPSVRPGSAEELSRMVALPNPHLTAEDLEGFEEGSPQSVFGELPPLVVDLDQIEEVLRRDCRGVTGPSTVERGQGRSPNGG